jgi:hypothetical protein
MESFQWITVTLSIVLGLGITGLLSAFVAVFRSRGEVRFDWIPLVWAGCIFLWQLQYWWGVIELSALIKTWTIFQFSVLLFLVLLLFIASALILPTSGLKKGESLAVVFEHDGRWALLFLSGYFVVAIVANWYLWGAAPLSPGELADGVLALLPLAFLWIPSRRGKVIVTILNALFSLWAAWLMSPKAY